MQDVGMTVLSAMVLGIAVTAAVSTLRGAEAPVAHRRLWVVYVLLAGLAAIPLVIAFSPSLYAFYMPATLPMLLALPPAVYAYVEELTAPDLAPPPRYHALLPSAGCFVMLGYWVLPGAQRESMFIEGRLPPGLSALILALATFVLIAAWILASLAYVIAILRRLNVFRTKLKDRYSNVATRELRWIEWLMAFLAILWAAVAATLLSDNFGPGLLFPGEWVLALAAIVLLFLFASAPTRTGAAADEADAATDVPTEKYARSALSDALAERLAARIEAAMREDHLYLDPNLSLQKLARHVAGAPNLVSQALNERIGSTFFDYVARWRIKAAKPMILANDQSILLIAMEVGFNSKSTFYKAFKKETGLTPLAFAAAAGADSQRDGGS